MLKDYKGNLSLVHFKVNEKNSEMISYHLTIFYIQLYFNVLKQCGNQLYGKDKKYHCDRINCCVCYTWCTRVGH